MRIKDNEHLELETTGETLYVNQSIIGISVDDLCLYEGYDGMIAEEQLSKKEKIEIAEYMIAVWSDYKRKAIRLG